MDLEEYSYLDKWNYDEPIEVTRRRMSKTVERKNYLASKGFLLIFKFREFLFNNAINYRYYFQDGMGQVQSRTFGEMDLLDFMIFSDVTIKLNPNEIKNKAKEGQKFFTQKMNQYINRYTNGNKNKYMQKINSGVQNLRIVRSFIMSKYNPPNRGLMRVNGVSYQSFNMGHIYESLDLALTDAELNYDKEKQNSNFIDNLMFGRYLKRDSVVASKGGDNFLTNTSIKSNSANLYSFNTISNQLYQIQKLLNLTNKTQLKKEIKNLFIDSSNKSKQIEQDLELSAEKAVDKLLIEIKKLTK